MLCMEYQLSEITYNCVCVLYIILMYSSIIIMEKKIFYVLLQENNNNNVETYGCWGTEARASSRLAARLALQLHCSKSKALVSIYQRLNLTLVRCAVRAYFHVSAPRPQRVKNFSLGLPRDFSLFMLLVHATV